MHTPATGQEKAAQEFEATIAQAQANGTQQTVQSLVNQGTVQANQPEQKAQAQEVPAVQPVKIGEEEYTPDQLAELVQKGKIVKEWEIEKPGYNLDTLYADYTKKTMELAELRRNQPQVESEIQLAPEDQQLLKKAVNPLIESALQQERDKMALDSFKNQHAEYNDLVKWKKYISFFNSYYKLPTEIPAQLTVMEMAHQNMNFEAEVAKKAHETKGQTLANMQKLEMASVGGGQQKTAPTPYDNLTPEQIRYMKEFGVL